jgi:hypothetical protein
MKATILTFDISQNTSIQQRLDKRLSVVNQTTGMSLSYESYTNPLKISVNNEYIDYVTETLKSANCILLESKPIFRATDYTFVNTGCKYSVSVDIDYLQGVIDRYAKSYGFDMDPDFQRGYVWTKQQQSEYIQYLLGGGKSGRDIYLNSPDWMGSSINPITVVDGKQRITALLEFINGTITIFDNIKYSDLRHSDKDNLQLIFNINDLTNKSDIVKWYISMNTGGTKHTEDDINVAKTILATI